MQKTLRFAALLAALVLPLAAAGPASAEGGRPVAEKAATSADRADKHDFQLLREALQRASKSGDQTGVKKLDGAIVRALEIEAGEQHTEIARKKGELAASKGEAVHSRREAAASTRDGRPLARADDRRDLRGDRRDVKDDARDLRAAKGEASVASTLLARYRGVSGRFDNQALHERDQILAQAIELQRREIGRGKAEVREDVKERREDRRERAEDRRENRRKAR